MTLWQEIHEQPEALARTLAGTATGIAALGGDDRVARCTHVVVAARGTSDNAARYAKYLWGIRNRRSVGLTAPSLFGPYRSPPDLTGALVVALSQSGASPDLVEVVEEAHRQRRPTVAITNRGDSPLAGAADHVLELEVGEERAVAATKSYTAELAVLAALSVSWASGDGSDELAGLPRVVEETLDTLEVTTDRVAFLGEGPGLAVVGRGYHHATAFELALKLQELARVLAHPYSAADFRHGPLALVEPGFRMIVTVADGALAGDLQALHDQVVALGADTLLLTNGPRPTGSRMVIGYPVTAEWLSPIAAIVAGQVVAHRLTEAAGLDPDSPRTITKVTRTR